MGKQPQGAAGEVEGSEDLTPLLDARANALTWTQTTDASGVTKNAKQTAQQVLIKRTLRSRAEGSIDYALVCPPRVKHHPIVPLWYTEP